MSCGLCSDLMSTQIALLKKYGLPIRGYSGQHLLIDPNMQRKMVDALNPSPKDKVLEIGPGLGALTEELLKRGSKVWAVEKDARFVEVLKGEFGQDYKDQLEIVHKDILKVHLDRWGPSKKKPLWAVISNLPYYITAPILFHLIHYRKYIAKAVLTMQKEVAQRIIASPGTKDYGRLSLAIRYAANARHLFDISPGCFTPKPEVDSSVLELVFHPASRMPKHINETFLFELIRISFGQRRKTLFHVLAHEPVIGLGKEELLHVFKTLEWETSVRAESLLLKDFLALAEKLGDKRTEHG